MWLFDECSDGEGCFWRCLFEGEGCWCLGGIGEWGAAPCLLRGGRCSRSLRLPGCLLSFLAAAGLCRWLLPRMPSVMDCAGRLGLLSLGLRRPGNVRIAGVSRYL